MAQMPIPETSGLEYRSFSVCWPDTLQWRGILNGFITTPTRGRFWDASTGSIIDAQAVGQQIASMNEDLEDCILSCTDAQGIIDAINGIPAAIAAQGQGNTTVSSACCPGGTDIGPDDWDGGVTPPDGFLEPTGGPATEDRICLVTNLIFNYLIDTLNKLLANGVQTIINALGKLAAPVIFGLVAAAITFTVTPGFIFDDILAAIIGFVSGIVFALIAGSVDIQQLRDDLLTNKDDVICAIVNSTDNQSARDNVEQVLIDGGVSQANRLVVDVMLSPYVLNVKDWDPDELQAGFEQALAELPGETCSCGCGDWAIITGTLISGSLSDDIITVESISKTSGGDPFEEMNVLTAPNCCTDIEYTMSVVPLTGCPAVAGANVFSMHDCGAGTPTTVVGPGTYSQTGQACRKESTGQLLRHCGSTFTVTFERFGQCI